MKKNIFLCGNSRHILLSYWFISLNKLKGEDCIFYFYSNKDSFLQFNSIIEKLSENGFLIEVIPYDGIVQKVKSIRNITLPDSTFKVVAFHDDHPFVQKFLYLSKKYNIESIMIEEGTGMYFARTYNEGRIKSAVKKVVFGFPYKKVKFLGDSNLFSSVWLKYPEKFLGDKSKASFKDIDFNLNEQGREFFCYIFSTKKTGQVYDAIILGSIFDDKDNKTYLHEIKTYLYERNFKKILFKPHPRDLKDYSKISFDVCYTSAPLEFLIGMGFVKTKMVMGAFSSVFMYLNHDNIDCLLVETMGIEKKEIDRLKEMNQNLSTVCLDPITKNIRILQ
jgi:hypothetical protein